MASVVGEVNVRGMAGRMSRLHINDEPPRVIKEMDAEIEQELAAVFAGVEILAFDAEGVDLNRDGRISLVQLATPEMCYLFDVLDLPPDDPLAIWLRKPLEDEKVKKIVHDCRMDSDALYHKLGITLTNVHDTSCWMNLSNPGRMSNLNSTLEHYGLAINSVRDSSMYRDNHAFWATRPLTPLMLAWASGDVQSMFKLRQRQLQGPTASKISREAESMTIEYLTKDRSSMIATVHVKNVGRFIGKGGKNLSALQRRTNTSIWNRGPRDEGKFIVFYQRDNELQDVRRAASQY
jgi:exonuclease 3'-5' domain-containing protein 1